LRLPVLLIRTRCVRAVVHMALNFHTSGAALLASSSPPGGVKCFGLGLLCGEPERRQRARSSQDA
jgi:hypothetical protein